MKSLIERTYKLIDQTWESFSQKVGNDVLEINKEASMQLNYSYLLQTVLTLVVWDKDESVTLELETGIQLENRIRECDIVVRLVKGNRKKFIPIELKCYRKLSSSGKPRGAQDIFMKDVYEDLQLLEGYQKASDCLEGMQLTMTDHRGFVHPKSKTSKNWHYDISDGYQINSGIHLTTPIGGKSININLMKNYNFNWKEIGEFYFLKLKSKDI